MVEVPVIAVDSGQNREICYQISDDRSGRLPRRALAPSLAWQVDGHHGPEQVQVAIVEPVGRGGAEVVGGVEVRRATPADLLLAWQRGDAVLEPLLLAAARAMEEDLDFAVAARRPARWEAARGVVVVRLSTPALLPSTR